MSADLMASASEAEADRDPGLGWFVYGVVPADAVVPDHVRGVDDRPVTRHAQGSVAAVTSVVPLDQPSARGADLRAYQQVLDTLAERGVPVAPVRFGSVVEDREVLAAELLAPREVWFHEVLEGLRGTVQLVVQGEYEQQLLLSAVVEADPEVAALREYTRGLPEDAAYGERVRLGELVARAVEDRQAADAAAFLEEVSPWCVALVDRPVTGLERAFDAALLVADDRREELEVRLERLAEELHPRVRVKLRGPMAPYDFVQEEPWD